MKTGLRIFLIAAGALLILDTVFVSTRSNGNLGTWLPAILGAPLLVIGIFYAPISAWFMSSGFGAFVKWAITACYALFILFLAVAGSFVLRGYNSVPDVKSDAVIVLGAGVRGTRVSLTLKYRLDAALSYMQDCPSAIAVVSGGQGSGEDISEAQAMYDYLVAHGIDGARIIKEDKSLSTYDNFALSVPLIRERLGNSASIAYVTTDFHVYRAGRIAEAQGLDCQGVSAPGAWYIAPNNFMRECVALTVYALTGKI